jgi:ribulose-bisphosphate carboxylase large chain
MNPSPDRVLATYQLLPDGDHRSGGGRGISPGAIAGDRVAPDRSAALALARAVARESTLEVPEGVASEAVEELLLGRVERLEPVAGRGWRAVLSHSPEILDGGLPQLLNVVHGNISLLPGVRLVDLALPDPVLERLPGPRAGIEGIRARAGGESGDASGRPLVAAAIKPVGLSSADLADLAATFARAGVDVVKDDHGITDQAFAPFEERVGVVAEAVARANREREGDTLYFPNVTGPVERLAERVAWAREAGCAGVLVCPGLVGLDALRLLAEAPDGLPIMSHPSRADVGPERATGVAPDLHFGLLHRLVGADAVVYVNAGGRFAWSLETCQAVNRRLRAPLGGLRAAFPVPAGGVDAIEAPRWFRAYGPDTMLLVGGSLLEESDVEEATRELVARAREAGAAEGAGEAAQDEAGAEDAEEQEES